MIMLMLKQKKWYGSNTAPYKRNRINFTIKDQYRIGIMHVRLTLSNADIPIYQYGMPLSKQKINVTGRTRICTDRRTHRQTEWFLYTTELHSQGGIENQNQRVWAHDLVEYLRTQIISYPASDRNLEIWSAGTNTFFFTLFTWPYTEFNNMTSYSTQP